MALINATSFAGLFLLLYLFSFVVFAILRITTGVSIQRIGYSGFRHIAYTLKEGIRIDIRGLGFSLHRPTFAQPTWLSLRLTELKVTIDPSLLGAASGGRVSKERDRREDQDASSKSFADGGRKKGRSQLWKRLTNVKEKIKRVHRKIHWLRMLDIIAINTSIEVVGVGNVNIGGLTMSVHTRRKLLDRGRLFRHKKNPSGGQKPAEWIFTTRSILFTISGSEPVEILDGATLNIHGNLYAHREGLRDTSIAVKVSRLHVPMSEILTFTHRMKEISSIAKQATQATSPVEAIPFSEVVQELDRPGSREASIVQTVADSKEFFSSILQSVQEIQLAMSFIRVSNEIVSLGPQTRPLILNVVTHEIGIDLHRLDQSTPSHRMYFSPKDIAHQALVAAISISVSLDDDDESNANKIMYIPMATTTIRTTLPSKTMTFTDKQDVAERNTNILFANLVVTSPSMDLEPRHLIQLLALAQKGGKPPSNNGNHRHRLISRLLPKASIKFSIHEPVIRFVLPAHEKLSTTNDYDMIISSISSIFFDLESSHSAGGELLYSLNSNFRTRSLQLYYQAASGVKYNLVTSESLELQFQINASAEVHVVISGSLKSFSILMVREEVSGGIYNIFRHFKRNVQPDRLEPQISTKIAFLRKLPAWLLDVHFEGHDCSIETAGIDKSISNQTRGLALQLESWTADYQCRKNEGQRRTSGRRKTSSSSRSEEALAILGNPPSPRSPKNNHDAVTDGRRLAIHVKGFEGFIIETLDQWEAQPFLSLPRLEVAFSTSRDLQGPIFHVNSVIRALYLHVSLYRFYSIGVAGSILKDAFQGPPATGLSSGVAASPPKVSETREPRHDTQHHAASGELVAIDVKAGSVHIKANMPHDPPMLLQIYEVAAGRHRWSAPFLRSSLLRLHAEAPHVKTAWARIASMNNIRLDIRQSRKKIGAQFIEEKSVDLSTDFIRLAVPHGFQMFTVFDNIANTSKAVKQLKHRFQTRTNEYVLSKEPEGPKHVPRISLRAKALMFEIEDDPFEWKLGTIYHIGQIEQKQRLARVEAFRVKVRRLNQDQQPRSSSRIRTQSHRPASRDTDHNGGGRRSRSQDSHTRKRSTSRGRRGRDGHALRYNREGVCNLSGSSKINAQDAWRRLEEHNARSWKKRIDGTLALQNSAVRNIRQMFSGADEPPHDVDEHERILEIPNRPGLMSTIISDLHLVIDKPSFPMSELPQFIHNVGKGMPLDMEYALLIPVHMSVDMGEARVMLRDYPLNLLHIPAIRPGQPPRLPSWSLRSDFVIAEEFRDDESSRHVKVDIVPKGKPGLDGVEVPGFSIDVRRTVSPVKTYSKPTIDINTSLPTTISWGTSYQPVIQDMMMIIEGFTKPEIDASDRVGFWDKIRMSFHSRPTINWKGDGDVQLRLKGSRDPYVVVGYGAGFVMCWRNDVQWAIHSNDDPKKFMTVTSGEYVLAIPDYSHQARREPEHHHDGDSMSSGSSSKNAAVFKKVIMKITGNVQWSTGLVFERDLDSGGRSFNFIPHYDVVLRNPKMLDKSRLENYDAFRGFRSNNIHLSVGIAAPFDRDWIASDVKPSDSYNTVHLSPRFFSHFFDWWHLFSGVMALPVRQGKLWRSPEKKSKKFGRHLATIKYQLLLAPLFIAHVYKHKEAEDYKEDLVSATGLKLRIDSFMLDLHQRREYFDTKTRGRSEQSRTSAMKMNKAELDFISADLRAVAASIAGTTAEELLNATDDILSSFQEPTVNPDLSRFEIPDHDFSWIDMDDFVELDWVLPSESNPETRILPLAYMPRFTYFRETDHGDAIAGDETRTSPFRDEPTHNCVMAHHNDPRQVQMDLIRTRLNALEGQIQVHQRSMGEQELRVVRDGSQDPSIKEEYESLMAQERQLETKRKFLENGLRRLEAHRAPGEVDHNSRHGSTTTSNSDLPINGTNPHVDMDGLFSAQHDEFASDFNNRFIVHNAQIKWNNSLRNIILRYSHQVSQRRGFVYYMSRRAVKFILDIVEEQSAPKKSQINGHGDQYHVPSTVDAMSPTEEKDEDTVVQDRIEQLLKDAKRFVSADDSADKEAPMEQRPSTGDMGDNIADSFLALNSYHVRAIAPQIQMQSEKNNKTVVLVSAKGMQFKVVSIMDKANMSDDVSGLVQRRFALDMDGAQFFVTAKKRLAKFIHLYSGNRYGNAPGSSWPPWVSLEVMFDFQLNPFGFQRVIQKTSASLRYEKYNPLRLKYNEQVASGESGQARHPERKESRIDHLWVDFPRIRASCDSAQYYAMYIMVLDLLMYSEPLEKTRSERLEKIMLASDFSDLRGAPEMATSLQERIRQLEDIKLHFQVNAKYLDRQGWQDRISLEMDLANCEDELFFIMKAITTSQQKNEDRKSTESSGLLRWYLSASEIVWHLMRDKNEPLLEFQLGHAAYERVDNSDGSNYNAMQIDHIRGLNLLSNALYPEIIGPFQDPNGQNNTNAGNHGMIQVNWHMLEAIAGIPVVEEFQVTMHPLKVQLERELGKRLFEYIFPGVGSTAFDSGNFSPFMVKNMEPMEEDDDSETEQASAVLSPERPLDTISHADMDSSHPGAMGRRLKPTYNFNHSHRPNSSSSKVSQKLKGLGIEHHSRFFSHRNHLVDSHSTPTQVVARKTSGTSLRSMNKRTNDTSMTNLAALNKSEEKKGHHNGAERSGSKKDRSKKKSNPANKRSDDLTQMMSRASNYMTLAHVKLDSFVICLSYKGKDARNLEDLHDFVLRMPTLEYRNKTWSNLDLALRLKKDVIKALISHTGAIIGNKFSHHRPIKQQQSRLRDLVSNSAILPNSDTLANTPSVSETGSLYSDYPEGEHHPASSRASFQSQSQSLSSTNPSPLLRSGSFHSVHSISNASTFSRDPDLGMTTVRATVPPHRSLLQNTLGRHFSTEMTKAERPGSSTGGQGGAEDSDPETHKKKSVLLLGKKILGSLT